MQCQAGQRLGKYWTVGCHKLGVPWRWLPDLTCQISAIIPSPQRAKEATGSSTASSKTIRFNMKFLLFKINVGFLSPEYTRFKWMKIKALKKLGVKVWSQLQQFLVILYIHFKSTLSLFLNSRVYKSTRNYLWFSILTARKITFNSRVKQKGSRAVWLTLI